VGTSVVFIGFPRGENDNQLYYLLLQPFSLRGGCGQARRIPGVSVDS
jgi:hypothetical protein